MYTLDDEGNRVYTLKVCYSSLLIFGKLTDLTLNRKSPTLGRLQSQHILVGLCYFN